MMRNMNIQRIELVTEKNGVIGGLDLPLNRQSTQEGEEDSSFIVSAILLFTTPAKEVVCFAFLYLSVDTR